MICPPPALLDAVEAEETLQRRRLQTVAEDFLVLTLRKLMPHAVILRLLTKEEAVRAEIREFYQSWVSKVQRFVLCNRNVTKLLGKHSYGLRAQYLAKWLRSVIASARRGTAAAPRASSLSTRNPVVVRTLLNCAVFGTLRLPPSDESLRGSQVGYRVYDELSILRDERGNRVVPSLTHERDAARSAIRSECSLVKASLDVWQRPAIVRRRAVELGFRELSKRKQMEAFEEAARRSFGLLVLTPVVPGGERGR